LHFISIFSINRNLKNLHSSYENVKAIAVYNIMEIQVQFDQTFTSFYISFENKSSTRGCKKMFNEYDPIKIGWPPDALHTRNH